MFSDEQIEILVGALEKEHSPSIRRIVGLTIWAQGCGVGDYDQNDVVQETMYRVTHKLKGGKAPEWLQEVLSRVVLALRDTREPEREDEKRVRAWLMRCALHILTDWMRPQRPGTVGEEVWAACAACTADHRAVAPDDIAAAREAGEILKAATAMLPAQERFVLIAREVQGWTEGEVAVRLGMRRGQVQRLYARAVTMLRARMGCRLDDLRP